MRILLIEDHPIVRAGCRRLLHGRDGIELIEAGTAAEGIEIDRLVVPDLVILDLNLPDRGGIDVLHAIRAARDDARVLVFSMYEDPAFVAAAMAAGAAGYVSKNDDPDTLIEAIARTGRGEMHLSHRVAQGLALARLGIGADPRTALSPREAEVFDLLGDGLSLTEIAEALGLGYRTVANIASQIKGKLGTASTAALVKRAVESKRPGFGRAP
jgi:DNA-binding NarL/FixJ family response regulator